MTGPRPKLRQVQVSWSSAKNSEVHDFRLRRRFCLSTRVDPVRHSGGAFRHGVRAVSFCLPEQRRQAWTPPRSKARPFGQFPILAFFRIACCNVASLGCGVDKHVSRAQKLAWIWATHADAWPSQPRRSKARLPPTPHRPSSRAASVALIHRIDEMVSWDQRDGRRRTMSGRVAPLQRSSRGPSVILLPYQSNVVCGAR